MMSDLTSALERDMLSVRTLPSRGPSQDLRNLLHRADADAAVVQTDALEALSSREQPAARERLRYLFRVPNKDLHILASRDITALEQLEGQKVNIGPPDSGTHLTARLVFDKIGIKPNFTSYDQSDARRRLLSGEIKAAILLASRPAGELLSMPADGRLHLVAIPFETIVSDYPPGQFTHEDYPNLIAPGGKVETLAVGHVLAVRHWPYGSTRYRRLADVAGAIHGHFETLQQTGEDPRWKDITLSADAAGWKRFLPARSLLSRPLSPDDERLAFARFAAASGICSVPESAAARERLYEGFAEWQKSRDGETLPPTVGPDPER